MTTVIAVKFKQDGKFYYFDPAELKIKTNEYVIVETARGTECGLVHEGNHSVADSAIVSPLKKVIRIADERDLERLEANRKKEKEAYGVCEELIAQHGLDMCLTHVECAFDGSKMIFFFTSEGRVDFRALVKDLASRFHTRIELRQIGVRDEAKMLGGLGICGQAFCCSRYLKDFQPVSIKMAKEQGLSLNPTKISGTCGRLMCCLKHEQDAYEHLISITPGINSTVKTPSGIGVVTDVNLITGNLFVKLENSELPIKINRSEVQLISGGKGKKPKKPAKNNADQ